MLTLLPVFSPHEGRDSLQRLRVCRGAGQTFFGLLAVGCTGRASQSSKKKIETLQKMGVRRDPGKVAREAGRRRKVGDGRRTPRQGALSTVCASCSGCQCRSARKQRGEKTHGGTVRG